MSEASLNIDWCSHEAAKYACEKWHYSRCIPKSKLAKFGVWENNKFIGAVIFGVGATNTLVRKYGLKSEEGCELVRVALNSHNAEVTHIISICIKKLKRRYPGLKLIVSFADPEQNHTGTIYRAGNWLYFGRTQPSDEYIYMGKRWQGRSFRNSYGGLEKSENVKIIKGSSKYRYLYPLNKDLRHELESKALDFQSKESGAVPTMTHQRLEKD